MSWETRLREAAYTAPDGTRQTFSYEDVRRGTDKKTSAFTFPDADGAFVQDTGRGGRRYPLRCFFHGADYDQAAAAFEALLWQRGPGVLEHPLYGAIDVVPTGEISRRDDLVEEAEQAIIQVEFFETIDLQWPRSQAHPAAEVATAIESYNATFADQFETLVNVAEAVGRADLRGVFNALLGSAKGPLRTMADAVLDIRDAYNDIETSIDRGIDLLVEQPSTLARQTSQLIQAPARAGQSINDRLDAYGGIADRVITGRAPETLNQLATDDLFASGALSGQVVSTLNHEFGTRREVFDAAERILSDFDTLQAWREEGFESLEAVDTGEAYQALQNAVATVAGYLVQISFDIAPEMRMVVARPRTMIDLCAELYGSVDDRLDFFITTNRLTGDEHIEIQPGREIVYYPGPL